MSPAAFVLDPRLDADTVAIIAWPLCDLRLMDDARFPWLVLIPRRAGLVEITDLDETEQARLWREVSAAATALRAAVPCDKLNVGALGNLVRQLHVHVIARREQDAAWPGPAWGSGAALAYAPADRAALITRLRDLLAAAEPPAQPA